VVVSALMGSRLVNARSHVTLVTKVWKIYFCLRKLLCFIWASDILPEMSM